MERRKYYRPRLSEWEIVMIKRLISFEYEERRDSLQERIRSDKNDPSIIPTRIIVKRLGRLLKKINRLLYGKYTLKVYKQLDELDILFFERG